MVNVPNRSGGGRKVDIDADAVLGILGGGGGGGGREDSDSSDLSEEGEEGEDVREVMEEMENELAAAGVRPQEGEGEEVGLMRNLLSSLAAQPEAAGPASNILHSLGIPVPDPD